MDNVLSDIGWFGVKTIPNLRAPTSILA